jgi:hypothetical protein
MYGGFSICFPGIKNCSLIPSTQSESIRPAGFHGLRKMNTNGCGTSHGSIGKPRVTELLLERDAINFGDVPEMVNALLQQGVAAYRHDRLRADQLFRQALAAAPTQLPIYFCLYKSHTYQGNLDEAETAATSGLREAALQAGWDPDWREWQPQAVLPEGAGRFALYTLKALAFIHLRQNNSQQANQILERLRVLDPAGAVGWPVIAALADGVG